MIVSVIPTLLSAHLVVLTLNLVCIPHLLFVLLMILRYTAECRCIVLTCMAEYVPQ